MRAEGYAGRIVLVGAERHPSHERPPLSKAVLSGEAAPETTHLFKPEEHAALDLDFRAEARATRIDRAAKRVALAGGESLPYDKLILTTGGTARRLPVPGGDSPRVLYLRTIEDSLAIRAALGPGKKLVVIGGGWIGLEVAATARKLGASVVVVEGLDRLCARTVPPAISAFLLARHEREGVEIRLGAGVKAIEDRGALVVRLADGSSLEADAVVAGIGLEPDVALARDAGLTVDNGILVDEQCRTSDPDVFAAGDCANTPLPCLGRRVRLESWANAQNQAIVAAKAALGHDVALRRAAVVLVGPVRRQPADPRAAGPVAGAGRPRRSGERQLLAVLSRRRSHRRDRRGQRPARPARGEEARADPESRQRREPRGSGRPVATPVTRSRRSRK